MGIKHEPHHYCCRLNILQLTLIPRIPHALLHYHHVT